MSKLKIPEGYQAVMPYLVVTGAISFSTFMQNVFDAKEIHKQMRPEGGVRHAQVNISGSTIMFADATEQFPVNSAGLFIYVQNADESYQKALDEGATSIMPPADQDYGRSCGVTDPFGNTWWITSVPV
jgi:PhnB protein